MFLFLAILRFMVKVRITDKGIITEPGDGVNIEMGASGMGFMPYSRPIQALTTDVTLTDVNAGVLTLSSSNSTPRTITLPAASSVPGSMFVFRSLSADIHVLTGSDAGIEVFAGQFGAGGSIGNGSRLQMPAVIGSAVTLLCDGRNYMVLGSSGTMTIDQS